MKELDKVSLYLENNRTHSDFDKQNSGPPLLLELMEDGFQEVNIISVKFNGDDSSKRFEKKNFEFYPFRIFLIYFW